MGSQIHQHFQLFLLSTAEMTEAARESMTSDASQTSALPWKREDARSFHWNIVSCHKILGYFVVNETTFPATTDGSAGSTPTVSRNMTGRLFNHATWT